MQISRTAFLVVFWMVVWAGQSRGSSAKEATLVENQRKLDGMIHAELATPSQVVLIRHILDEQGSLISLFGKYGLLSEGQLAEKVRLISEVANSRIESLFDEGQRRQWLTAETLRPARPKIRRSLFAPER